MDTVTAPVGPDQTRLDAYDHASVETRWGRIWDERGDYRIQLDDPEHVRQAAVPDTVVLGIRLDHARARFDRVERAATPREDPDADRECAPSVAAGNDRRRHPLRDHGRTVGLGV